MGFLGFGKSNRCPLCGKKIAKNDEVGEIHVRSSGNISVKRVHSACYDSFIGIGEQILADHDSAIEISEGFMPEKWEDYANDPLTEDEDDK